MKILLEEYYAADIINERFHNRKILLQEDVSYLIRGITQSGKSRIVKNYLQEYKKSSYLYLDCSDLRLDIAELNKELQEFCREHKIERVVLDNYLPELHMPKVKQLIVVSSLALDIDSLETLVVYPLDYEEFLAYEHKYDLSALNNFFKLGALPHMHKVPSDERVGFVQSMLKKALDAMEVQILIFCANGVGQKLSAFAIYERLKQSTKVSKDRLYRSFHDLVAKCYIHQLQKFNHPKALQKLYICDISLKLALSTQKNFARLFENVVYLELLKSHQECYYEEGVDFYLPHREMIILCMPFGDERMLFKKLEKIEAFIFSFGIKYVTTITMSKEGTLSHPLSQISLVPFDIWALSDV